MPSRNTERIEEIYYRQAISMSEAVVTTLATCRTGARMSDSRCLSRGNLPGVKVTLSKNQSEFSRTVAYYFLRQFAASPLAAMYRQYALKLCEHEAKDAR